MVDLASYRRRLVESQQDAGLDAEWDELMAAVREAWSWRDPESLWTVDVCLSRLRTTVLEDWGYPVRKG